MSKKRRQYSAKYKFQVAMEAAQGQKTLSELSSETGIHPNQISVRRQSELLGLNRSTYSYLLRDLAITRPCRDQDRPWAGSLTPHRKQALWD